MCVRKDDAGNSKEGSSRFPGNDEFMEAFGHHGFYCISGYKYYLFDRLENGDSAERANVVDGLRDEVYSVEHIMPQTLSSGWIQDLGDAYEAVHEKWLNSMANLTLTAYNSKYSNRRFLEKRDMKDGFKDFGFRINDYVRRQSEWGEDQLKKRDEQMRERFLSLWPMISSAFEWGGDAYEEHALDDDFDFTGRRIAAYGFMGSRFTVKTWVDMICGVLSMVYELDPIVLHRFVSEKSEFPSRYFSSEEISYSFKVGEGIYFNLGSSTAVKVEALKVIFEAADIDASELTFELYKIKGECEPEK